MKKIITTLGLLIFAIPAFAMDTLHEAPGDTPHKTPKNLVLLKNKGTKIDFSGTFFSIINNVNSALKAAEKDPSKTPFTPGGYHQIGLPGMTGISLEESAYNGLVNVMKHLVASKHCMVVFGGYLPPKLVERAHPHITKWLINDQKLSSTEAAAVAGKYLKDQSTGKKVWAVPMHKTFSIANTGWGLTFKQLEDLDMQIVNGLKRPTRTMTLFHEAMVANGFEQDGTIFSYIFRGSK